MSMIFDYLGWYLDFWNGYLSGPNGFAVFILGHLLGFWFLLYLFACLLEDMRYAKIERENIRNCEARAVISRRAMRNELVDPEDTSW